MRRGTLELETSTWTRPSDEQVAVNLVRCNMLLELQLLRLAWVCEGFARPRFCSSLALKLKFHLRYLEQSAVLLSRHIWLRPASCPYWLDEPLLPLALFSLASSEEEWDQSWFNGGCLF